MLTHYSNLQQFYRGRTHTLFRGKRFADDQDIVVKTSNNEAINALEIASLQSEHRLLRQCAGAGIAKVFALIPFGTKIAVVMEDAGQKTLADILSLRRLDLATALRFAVKLAEVAAHIHDCGVVHQDLNPANIVVSGDEQKLTLVDFEKAIGQTPRTLTKTQPLAATSDGTLTYVSPEQTGRMNRSVDHRSDLYSLGIIFYEMLTGHVPFSCSDPLELVHAHLSRIPDSPRQCNSDVPEVLSDIVLRLLAKAPEDRYHSAYGLLQDLQEVQTLLLDSGEISEFAAGMPKPRGLAIPERLYGRSAESARLMEAFQRVAERGVPELVLISGSSGVGKTTLVRELHRPLTKERGLFASGKFDQHKRDVPFSTVAQAFREAVRHILTEPEERINQWTRDLKDALGLSGALLTTLIPEIELLVGKQPSVPELSAADEQKRFDSLFRKFVEVFARREHPLVLFLDDLQWADPASLRIIRNLICDPGPLHLLLLGAYRDNEVEEWHALKRLIVDLQKAPAAQECINLQPLSHGHLSSMVSDALGCNQDAAQSLVRVIFDKTQGNPFFAVQFLQSLYQENLLTYNQAKGKWEWDLERLHAIGYSDNVLDLLADKMMKLPATTREVLLRAAYLGNKVDLATLRTVMQDKSTFDSDILHAVDAGLVLKVDDSIKFLHDRVQQAAYNLIPEAQKSATHLLLGRMLSEDSSDDGVLDERIFDVVNQLNQGAALLDDQPERTRLAALNFRAGRKARASTAYGSAIKFFNHGLNLLDERAWKANHQLAYNLHFDRAECEWLLGNYTEAESQFEQLLPKSKTKLNKANIYRMQVELYTSKVELSTALDRGLKALKLLGINISAHPSRDEVVAEYNRIWQNIGERKIEDLVHLPAMDSPEMTMAMDILVALYTATLCSDQNLFLLTGCHMVNITLQYGNCNASAMGYGFIGMGLGPFFGKYEDAYRFGKLGYDLVQLHGLSGYRAKINFIFGDTINFFRRHLRTDMDYLDVAFTTAVQVGDIPFACYSCNHICTNLLVLGEPLDSVYRETERRLEYTRRANFDASYQAIIAMQRFVHNMRGETNSSSTFSDSNFNEASYDSLMGEYGQPIVRCWYYILKIQSRVMFGQYAQAVDWLDKAQPLLWSTLAHIQEQEFWFYGGLALAGNHANLPLQQREANLSRLAIHRDYMARLADACPENFLHKYYLLSAEIARINEDHLAAEPLYEKAAQSARENGYVQTEGLANELAGTAFVNRGLQTAALGYLEAARQCYKKWGANGKVDHLEKSHPGLRQGGNHSSEPLDSMAMFKAARAISSEVVLDRLLETLMRVVVTASGARRGVLVLEDDGELVVRAHGPFYDGIGKSDDAGSGRIAIVEIPVASYSGAPHSVLNYVSRAKEAVLLNNAAREGVFADDPHIREQGTRSVLCIPMIKQERLIGVLYLENNLSPSVFTTERLELMELLSCQIVTALENGMLFEAMRREVTERKRAEDALRMSEQHLRSAFEVAAVGMVQVDVETHRFARVNAKYCQMLGYSAEELLSMKVEDITMPQFVESHRKQWCSLDAGSVNEVSVEKEYIRKDGKIIRVQVNAALIRYDDGRPWITLAVVNEIGKRRKTNDSLNKLMHPGYQS